MEVLFNIFLRYYAEPLQGGSFRSVYHIANLNNTFLRKKESIIPCAVDSDLCSETSALPWIHTQPLDGPVMATWTKMTDIHNETYRGAVQFKSNFQTFGMVVVRGTVQFKQLVRHLVYILIQEYKPPPPVLSNYCRSEIWEPLTWSFSHSTHHSTV